MIDKLGDYLGEGFRRIVYEHKDDDSLVIKFLKNLKDDHNKLEYQNWLNWKDTDRGLWLVPCVAISKDGRFLIQKKVQITDKIPDNVPQWIQILGDWTFGGNKSKHWGLYEGRMVLVDYGDKEL